MKKSFVLLAVLAAMFLAACGGSSGKVLVDVNGNKITEGDLKFLGEINPRMQQQIENPVNQKRVLENLVEQDLLYQEALKEGLQREKLVKAKIELYKKVIIAQSLIEAETEKAVKKYYEEHPEEFKKLKVSDIMIKFATPDEIKAAKKGEKLRSEQEALKFANEVKARLDKGEEFAKVAQEVSDDAGSKARGGDLGLVSKGDKRMESRGMLPVVDKAFEMKVSEIAGPIKTDKGYHIITVTRGVEVEPFTEAKQGLMFKVGNESKQGLVDRLKKNAKITWPEEEKAKAAAEKKAKEAPKPAEQKAPEAAPAPGNEAAAAPGAAKPEAAAPAAEKK